jgi:hypothetical protein
MDAKVLTYLAVICDQTGTYCKMQVVNRQRWILVMGSLICRVDFCGCWSKLDGSDGTCRVIPTSVMPKRHRFI